MATSGGRMKLELYGVSCLCRKAGLARTLRREEEPALNDKEELGRGQSTY